MATPSKRSHHKTDAGPVRAAGSRNIPTASSTIFDVLAPLSIEDQNRVLGAAFYMLNREQEWNAWQATGQAAPKTMRAGG